MKYFHKLSNSVKSGNGIKLKNIPSDKVLQTVTQNVSTNAVIIAFLVGALTTVPAVLFEMYLKENYTPTHYYLLLALITMVFLVIEVATLYWLGMRSVYTLASLTGYEQSDETLPMEYDIKNMMVRSALEIDDPAIEYLGIDPQKYVSKKWLIVRTLLYKAKIVLTSLVLRFILRKIAIRYGLRISFLWITIPITAIWDAFVMYRIIDDAKLRLFGYYLSFFVAEEILSKEKLQAYSESIDEGLIRAVSTITVLSKSYHPNNILLLIRLSKKIEVNAKKDYDNLTELVSYLNECDEKEKHLLRIISGVSAIFDAKLNRDEERALEVIFGEQKEHYFQFCHSLKELLIVGKIHQAATLCEETIAIDFK